MSGPLSLEQVKQFTGYREPALFDHQFLGVWTLVHNLFFLLADEMGAGKTRQAIETAQWLIALGVIDTVLVVCPASVRSVWFDEELGELAKYLWLGTDAHIIEYHAKFRTWAWGKPVEGSPRWLVTNYDYLRSGAEEERIGRRKVYHFPIVDELKAHVGPKTLLILDESSAVKNPKALQTLATLQLRNLCGRVMLLNGTPIADNPMDLYAQGQMMDRNILQCKDFYEYRARYAVVDTSQGYQKILRYVNLEDLQRRFAPYVLRRLKKDCLDLPEKLPAVNLVVPLSPKTWKMYVEMREELCTWLDRNSVTAAAQAPVKVLRLAQITSGFLGGVEEAISEEELDGDLGDWLPPWEGATPMEVLTPIEKLIEPAARPVSTREVGREKLDALLKFFRDLLDVEDRVKLLVWCRFRPELERLLREAPKVVRDLSVGAIYGSQKREEQDYAKRLLDPRTAPYGPALVVGTPQTGRAGLSLTAAHHVIYSSHDFSLFNRVQSEDRTHRPGQKSDVNYYNLVASGPKGQKTVDHLALKVIRDKDDLAQWTTKAWVRALKDE